MALGDRAARATGEEGKVFLTWHVVQSDHSSVALLPFYGHDIQSWRDEETGKVYVGMRHVCKTLGIGWDNQRYKVLHSKIYQGHTNRHVIMTVMGLREVIGLNLEMLPTFLLSISAEKVSPLMRETLLLFQRECAQVLAASRVEKLALAGQPGHRH